MIATAARGAAAVLAEPAGVAVPAPRRPPALSPSRAGDFRRCPLLYRFRAVDRLPEPPSPPLVRGTVVHAALERLFGLPAPDRRPGRARELAETVPEHAELDAAGRARVGELLDRYFTMEDPRRIEPAACELRVEATLPSGTPLRGYVDRLDAGPCVVDYKSGCAPRPRDEVPALYGVKFYALALLRGRGVLPRAVRLMYLGDATTLTVRPGAGELHRFGRTLDALWAAVRRAAPDGDFRPRPGPGCAWCPHRALCPAFGGRPPEYPGWPETEGPHP